MQVCATGNFTHKQKEIMLTTSSFLFSIQILKECPLLVQKYFVITQDQPYKLILPLEAYVMKG
jgi:hypothetical protein